MPPTPTAISRAILVVLLLTPTLTRAENSHPADEHDSQAYQDMLDQSDEATDDVRAGRYEFGAVRFRQAFQAFPDPILLKNEMIAWYRAGDCRNALPPAQQFLRSDDVQPEDQDDVTTVQLECHLLLAEQAIDDDNTLLAAFHLDSLDSLHRDDAAEQRYQSLRDQLRKRSGSTPILPDPPAPQVSSSASHFAWVQILAGVTTAGTGVVLHALALDRQRQLESASQSGDPRLLERHLHEWGDFQNLSRWAVPALYIAGGLAIGSGTFFLLRDAAQPDVSLSTSLGPNHAGLSVSGRFK